MIGSLKPVLETYAYNILGSFEDARDVVQDLELNLLENPRKAIDNRKSYLIKSVINRSINLKKKNQRLQRNYPGAWLPQPVDTEGADARLGREEMLSYSLLVLLENLTAQERAVFILKEAFTYSHRDIAEALEISEDYSRQLLRRGKKKLKSMDRINVEDHWNVPKSLLTAIQNGDMEQLEQVLHRDIVLTSDSGGKVPAARRPLAGIDKVDKFLKGIYKKFYKGIDCELRIVNHQPAVLYFENRILITCMVLHIFEGKILNIYVIRNPDKLQGLAGKLE